MHQLMAHACLLPRGERTHNTLENWAQSLVPRRIRTGQCFRGSRNAPGFLVEVTWIGRLPPCIALVAPSHGGVRNKIARTSQPLSTGRERTRAQFRV